jgi:hypothetical protein
MRQEKPEVGAPPTAGAMVTTRAARLSVTVTSAPFRSRPARAARSRATRSASARLGSTGGRNGLAGATGRTVTPGRGLLETGASGSRHWMPAPGM